MAATTPALLNHALETRVYRAFRSLDRAQRREVALRILGDQRILGDLYDHFLIQGSLSEKGKSVAWNRVRRTRP